MNSSKSDGDMIGLALGLLPFGLTYLFGFVMLCIIIARCIAEKCGAAQVQSDEELYGSREDSTESSVRAPGAESDTEVALPHKA